MISNELMEIMGPALIAGLMVALIHAPLGIEVLRRGIIFIDLAIAQIAGLGLVMAQTLLQEPSWWAVQGSALLFALLAGWFFHLIAHKAPAQQEAIIGCSFVLAASLSLLLLADHPQGGEEIQHLLSGQILFVTWGDILSHAPVYVCILLLWFGLPKIRSGIWFYALFAVAITSSVQLVGVYMVFASLILPALAALHTYRPHVIAWCCGILSVTAGIVVSAYTDLAAGPLLVVAYTLTALACATWMRMFHRR